MQFQIGGGCRLGFVYDTNRPAFLESDLLGLSVNGNWQVWVRYCSGEAVSIHTKTSPAFPNYTVFHI